MRSKQTPSRRAPLPDAALAAAVAGRPRRSGARLGAAALPKAATVALQGRAFLRRRPGAGAGAEPARHGRPAARGLRRGTAVQTRSARPRASSRPTGSPAPRCAWRCATRNAPTARRPSRAGRPQAGVMYVFMPPLAHLEDYLELLAAVEATAAELGVKVVLEGYPPPRDPRLKLLQVTPDPGVIEVNIHPAHDWANWSTTPSSSTRRRTSDAPVAPRSSCSTAATPAPAAATTSCSAAPRRPTAPSCAGPTCWPA
jgi:hypothetical protein